jgi:N-acyl homoserine lactone hydrolase
MYDGTHQAREGAMTKSKFFRKTFPLLLVAVMILVAGVVSAAPPQKPKPPKTTRLYIFDCGLIPAIDVGLFNFKKEDLAETRMVVPCFLVVHPKGTLMWDVGAIPDSAFTADGAPVSKDIFYATKTLASQMAAIGYAPSDITFMALSHYHRDHIANANLFAGSTWLVSKVEHDAMFADKPPERVDPKAYTDLKNSKTVILTKDEYDVFGDGKVIIKSAPGHTPGHQVLILKLAKTGNVMVAGDLYHYPEERTTHNVPTFEYNKEQSLASRAMIEDYIKKNHTQMWIEHDFTASMKLKKSPEYYE